MLSLTSLPLAPISSLSTLLLLPTPSQSAAVALDSLLFLKHANHILPQDLVLFVPSAWNAFPPQIPIRLLPYHLQASVTLSVRFFPD